MDGGRTTLRSRRDKFEDMIDDALSAVIEGQTT